MIYLSSLELPSRFRVIVARIGLRTLYDHPVVSRRIVRKDFMNHLLIGAFSCLFVWQAAPTSGYTQEPTQAAASPTNERVPEPSTPIPPHRERLTVGGSFYFSLLLPTEGYARETRGVGIDGGVWIQNGHLAIEPRLSIRFDLTDPGRDYVHLVPLELGTYGLLKLETASLFLGPGLGLHLISEVVELERTVGSTVIATSKARIDDDVFGVGVFGRAGVILNRTSVISVSLSLDYALTFAEFQRSSYESAVRANLGLVFGRGR
jgi:hypothetical protein